MNPSMHQTNCSNIIYAVSHDQVISTQSMLDSMTKSLEGKRNLFVWFYCLFSIVSVLVLQIELLLMRIERKDVFIV